MVKIVPSNIASMLTPSGLAYWIMDDGYWDGKTIKLCTEVLHNLIHKIMERGNYLLILYI
jgi:hypothetical protein